MLVPAGAGRRWWAAAGRPRTSDEVPVRSNSARPAALRSAGWSLLSRTFSRGRVGGVCAACRCLDCPARRRGRRRPRRSRSPPRRPRRRPPAPAPAAAAPRHRAAGCRPGAAGRPRRRPRAAGSRRSSTARIAASASRARLCASALLAVDGASMTTYASWRRSRVSASRSACDCSRPAAVAVPPVVMTRSDGYARRPLQRLGQRDLAGRARRTGPGSAATPNSRASGAASGRLSGWWAPTSTTSPPAAGQRGGQVGRDQRGRRAPAGAGHHDDPVAAGAGWPAPRCAAG